MKQLSVAAVERAMKLQDVMLRTMAKRITWLTSRRLLEANTKPVEHFGHNG